MGQTQSGSCEETGHRVAPPECVHQARDFMRHCANVYSVCERALHSPEFPMTRKKKTRAVGSTRASKYVQSDSPENIYNLST